MFSLHIEPSVLLLARYVPNVEKRSISYEINVSMYTLCSEKNTHSHFLSYLHELFMDLNNNCSEYTQGLTDTDNVKISTFIAIGDVITTSHSSG